MSDKSSRISGTPSVRWARSATRHRISKSRIRHVIEHSEVRFKVEAPRNEPARRTTRLVYLGDDSDGVPLEVIAVELENGELLVIHAMLLRKRYAEQYQEAKRWRI